PPVALRHPDASFVGMRRKPRDGAARGRAHQRMERRHSLDTLGLAVSARVIVGPLDPRRLLIVADPARRVGLPAARVMEEVSLANPVYRAQPSPPVGMMAGGE